MGFGGHDREISGRDLVDGLTTERHGNSRKAENERRIEFDRTGGRIGGLVAHGVLQAGPSTNLVGISMKLVFPKSFIYNHLIDNFRLKTNEDRDKHARFSAQWPAITQVMARLGAGGA